MSYYEWGMQDNGEDLYEDEDEYQDVDDEEE